MTQSPPYAADNVKLAIFAVISMALSLSLGDALIKKISSDFPLWQMFVIRSAIAVPVLIAIIRIRGRSRSLIPTHIGWTALRSLLLALMWVAYYAALPHVPLPTAAAVYYTLPLFVTLFAAFFLGEKAGIQGWVAICIGFCGVLLIVRPQAGAINVYALLPLISAILFAFAILLTRTKCRGESPLVLSLSVNVSFIVVGFVATLFTPYLRPLVGDVSSYSFLLGEWISMGSSEWLAMSLLAVAIILGSTFAAIAYQNGPASTVATFDFTYLPFAACWGFLFFAEIPDTIAIIGIFMIAGAGILAVRR